MRRPLWKSFVFERVTILERISSPISRAPQAESTMGWHCATLWIMQATIEPPRMKAMPLSILRVPFDDPNWLYEIKQDLRPAKDSEINPRNRSLAHTPKRIARALYKEPEDWPGVQDIEGYSIPTVQHNETELSCGAQKRGRRSRKGKATCYRTGSLA